MTDESGGRNLTTTVNQVFGNVRKGTECRICGRNVADGRMKYCSDYCKNIANAVMGMLNWSTVRRHVIKRDNETCQSCGFNYSRVRRARRQVRERIDEQLPEKPEAPSMLKLGRDEVSDEEIEEHREAWNEWHETQERLQDRYNIKVIGNDRSLEVDHVTPISEGGHPFDPGNLQTLCAECHEEKTSAEAAERAETPTSEGVTATLTEYVEGGGDPYA